MLIHPEDCITFLDTQNGQPLFKITTIVIIIIIILKQNCRVQTAGWSVFKETNTEERKKANAVKTTIPFQSKGHIKLCCSVWFLLHATCKHKTGYSVSGKKLNHFYIQSKRKALPLPGSQIIQEKVAGGKLPFQICSFH